MTSSRQHQTGAARGFALPTLLASAAVLLGACANTPPPVEQVAVSTQAVANAVTAGGGESAAAEMGLARDKLGRANRAMAAKEYDRALVLAEEAQVDAQLASAKARSSKARKAADELEAGIRVLREEMDRKATLTPAPK